MLLFMLAKSLLAYEYFEEPRLIDRVDLSFGKYDAFYMPLLEAQEAFDACSNKGRVYQQYKLKSHFKVDVYQDLRTKKTSTN